MSENIQLEIYENEGMVVLRFGKATNEISIMPEMAREVAEEIARKAYEGSVNATSPINRSLIVERLRAKLVVRIDHVIRNLHEKGKSYEYIAQEVTDMVLREVT